MIGAGSPINQFGAIPFMTLSNAKVMEGIAFSMRKRFAIAKSTSIDIVLDPTAFTGKAWVVLPIAFEAIAGPILVDIYSGVTANNDGTLVSMFNRNLVIGTPPVAIARLDPTNVILPGTPPIEYLIPSDGQGATVQAGTGGDSLVANVDFSKKLLVRFTNSDTVSDAVVGVKVDFFEVQ
jgi:hypothetical protein